MTTTNSTIKNQAGRASDGRHRVVIVGGGFGGLRAAKALSRLPVDVTLVDRVNHHLFQPLLYQVATGVLSAGQIAPPLRSLFRHHPSVRVLLADVQGFDLERRLVHAQGERAIELPYDTLIVAAGASHSYFGHDDWTIVAPGMKTLDDANRVRSRILAAFELAELAEPGREREAWLTFAIVGAGPTGVELAGQLAILTQRILRGEYRAVNPAKARIVLLDAAPTVLPMYPPKPRAHAERDLRKLGIDVQLDSAAVNIDPYGIDVDGQAGRRRLPARTVIWSAGVKASPLAAALAAAGGAERDRAGRLLVAPDLTLPGHPEVFAIGDLAAVPDVPGVAPAAIQEGAYVAKVVRARLRGKRPPRPFEYRDKGTIAIIGRGRAVGNVFGVNVAGLPASLAWALIHLRYLVGWGNRFGTVARWMWTGLARDRRERLISVVSVVSDERAQAELDERLRGVRRSVGPI